MKTEIIEITVPVEIGYRNPEGREEAIEWAERNLHLNGWSWSTSAGGFSAKRVAK